MLDFRHRGGGLCPTCGAKTRYRTKSASAKNTTYVHLATLGPSPGHTATYNLLQSEFRKISNKTRELIAMSAITCHNVLTIYHFLTQPAPLKQAAPEAAGGPSPDLDRSRTTTIVEMTPDACRGASAYVLFRIIPSRGPSAREKGRNSPAHRDTRPNRC